MAGFGVPVNASSFGNTLIVMAGTTLAAVGLVYRPVIGLGAAVAQLQRLNEALGVRLPEPVRPSARYLEPPAGGTRKAPASRGRIPFPA